jgi:hypothetical protein
MVHGGVMNWEDMEWDMGNGVFGIRMGWNFDERWFGPRRV